MNVTHKILSTGYHHVRAVGYAHLFAQWPVGTRLSLADISDGEMPVSVATLNEFASAAKMAADTIEANNHD